MLTQNDSRKKHRQTIDQYFSGSTLLFEKEGLYCQNNLKNDKELKDVSSRMCTKAENPANEWQKNWEQTKKNT